MLLYTYCISVAAGPSGAVDESQFNGALPTSKHPISWASSNLASGLCSQWCVSEQFVMLCVFSCLEREVCQTAGSAAQLLEDWLVYVPGTDCFSLLSQIQKHFVSKLLTAIILLSVSLFSLLLFISNLILAKSVCAIFLCTCVGMSSVWD